MRSGRLDPRAPAVRSHGHVTGGLGGLAVISADRHAVPRRPAMPAKRFPRRRHRGAAAFRPHPNAGRRRSNETRGRRRVRPCRTTPRVCRATRTSRQELLAANAPSFGSAGGNLRRCQVWPPSGRQDDELPIHRVAEHHAATRIPKCQRIEEARRRRDWCRAATNARRRRRSCKCGISRPARCSSARRCGYPTRVRAEVQIGRARHHGGVPGGAAIQRAQIRAAGAAGPNHGRAHGAHTAQGRGSAARLRDPESHHIPNAALSHADGMAAKYPAYRHSPKPMRVKPSRCRPNTATQRSSLDALL
jgi:hypothetical protein